MRSVIYLLFFVSGFVGLIYEAIFSRYLKLFLGHSAYGQLLTLVVFMGGLGLGAFIAGRYTGKIRNAFKAYAWLELAAGVWGALFHPLYTGATGWFYNHVDWFTGLPGGIVSAKVFLSIVMTVPCAMLLGMTFPLLAVGVMRLTGDGGKRTLSNLYFTNSIGAALGILVTSYFFLRQFGTHGSLLLAACGNVLVGAGFYAISRRLASSPASGRREIEESLSPSADSSRLSPDPLPNARLWLAIAFGTGFASFIYEIGWIRLLSLLLGSSTHSFDIMISAFVLGLAFGGLFAKRLIARCVNIPSLMATVQVLMGIFAVCSIYLYKPFFLAINASHAVFQNSESAFYLYSGFKYLLALGLMFPASFCAGITLPVITFYLCSRPRGERHTGYVYGWNTIGSVTGAVLGALVLLPLLQLKWTLAAGAAIDMALGLIILSRFPANPIHRRVAWAAVAVALIPLTVVRFEESIVARGAFRKHIALGEKPETFIAYRDGRTATISLRKDGPAYSLATNGKTDGAVIEKSQRGKVPQADDSTVAQLAFLPALTQSKPYNCAIIGMGTGMTPHHMLADDLLQEIDLIEIEEAVLDISALMRPTNERAFADDRVNYIVQDAKSYFYQSGKKYDLIISEPSNPWVSGVSSLFTKEYYRQLRRFLKPGGLLVQWAHSYEFSDDLAFSIMAALSEFPHFEIFDVSGAGDYMIIAGEAPFAFQSFQRWNDNEGIRADFDEMGWEYHQLGPANFIASSDTVRPIIEKWKPATNSDYFPYVDQFAELHLFTKSKTKFQSFFKTGLGCYQELYEPERLRHLKSVFGPTERPGYDSLPNGKLLYTLLRGLDPEGEWAAAEFGLIYATKEYFFSGFWHELEPVVAYADLVDKGIAPGKYATRFRYLHSIATGDTEETARHLPAAIDTFSIIERPDDLWLRSLIVNAAKLGRTDLIIQLAGDFIDTNPAFSPDEATIIADVVKRAAAKTPRDLARSTPSTAPVLKP